MDKITIFTQPMMHGINKVAHKICLDMLYISKDDQEFSVM